MAFYVSVPICMVLLAGLAIGTTPAAPSCSGSNLCKNGGTCVVQNNRTTCVCLPNFTGDQCTKNVDECLSRPCKNGATCTNSLGGYKCRCSFGWEGLDCSINTDECKASDLNPRCQNGGTCVDMVGRYSCICPAGKTGNICQFDDTCYIGNPCHGLATCVTSPLGSYTCMCPRGWIGNNCSIDINECSGSSATLCHHGGTCRNTQGSFVCDCPPGFTGSRCERRLGDCPDLGNFPNGKVRTSRGPNKFAVYRCNSGYKMSGISFRRCTGGTWSGKAPVCILSGNVQSCGRPEDILHGDFDGDTFTVGSTVKYFCNDKYRLKGDAVLKCSASGKWQPRKTPRCLRKLKCRDPGTPKHGRRDGSLFLEGTQVRFSCDEGYELVGHSSLSCDRSCYSCKTVRWNSVKPKCRKIDPLKGLQRVAENLRKHFIDKLSWLTTDGLARSGLSTGAGGLDLVFVFDSSASVGKTNFKKGIEFAKTIIDEFGISTSPTGTRVAVVTFSSTAKVVFNLQSDEIRNKSDAITRLENLDYIRGGTATSRALNKTIEEIVPQTRNNSKKALFLVTDGRSNDGGVPSADAMILRDSCDFEIYAIGVTNSVDENELRSIASEPFRTHVYLLKEFEDLAKLKELITASGTDYSECGIAGDTQLRNALGKKFRIVGGREVKPGAWPWQAAIYVKGNFRCGGALVKENWVLTAAHCFFFDGKVDPQNIMIRMGEHDRFKEEGAEQNKRAQKLFIYPNASLDRLGDDLALVRLQTPVKLSPFVRPVCLPQPNDVFYARPGKPCLIAGWGSTQKVSPEDLAGAPHPVLQQIQMKLVSRQDCRENATHAQAITDKVICAGDSKGERDACKGDSGSPLVIRRSDDSWAVLGLSSWGEGCATQGKYGVYTKVESYMRWINRRINKKKNKN